MFGGVCYLDMKPLTVIFFAGLPGSGSNMSLILTQPAVPTPTTTAPNILTEKQRLWSEAKTNLNIATYILSFKY